MKIEELCLDERPREKLVEKGAEALSNAELLAILLRSGTPKMNALEVARSLLGTSGGSLANLSAMSIERMLSLPGMGIAKAASVVAAFELGRRFAYGKAAVPKIAIESSSQVYAVMSPILKGLDHEECWILFLNRAHYIMCREKISSGGLSSTSIDVMAICSRALEMRSPCIILVHNHPSANPRPSASDTSATEELSRALHQVKIEILDHLIVSDDSYFSFAENRVFEVGEQ
ncbi:MAG: DNA repair protein RadC [Candidatus Cryptobacteroides sp.]